MSGIAGKRPTPASVFRNTSLLVNAATSWKHAWFRVSGPGMLLAKVGMAPQTANRRESDRVRWRGERAALGPAPRRSRCSRHGEERRSRQARPRPAGADFPLGVWQLGMNCTIRPIRARAGDRQEENSQEPRRRHAKAARVHLPPLSSLSARRLRQRRDFESAAPLLRLERPRYAAIAIMFFDASFATTAFISSARERCVAVLHVVQLRTT